MHTINAVKCPLVFAISLTFGTMTFADGDMHDHSQMEMPLIKQDHSIHQDHLPLPQDDHMQTSMSVHDHKKEHGGQIYSSIHLDQSWRSTFDGHAVFKSDNELKIGTDEQKLILQLEAEKPESQSAKYDAKLLYSHMISDFWDIQTGLGYQLKWIEIDEQDKHTDHVNAVFGIQGLAPYFFETSAYLSLSKDDYVALSFEAERDFLLTQKLIVQPYIELDAVLNDASRYAEKTGLQEASVGLETRYEISKQFMPYVDIAYRYEQESEWNNGQRTSNSLKDWMYGLGIKFKF